MASDATPARTQSIRTKIVILLAIPLLALVCLWAGATVAAFGPARELYHSREFSDKLARPALDLVDALQHERRMSMALLGNRSLDSSGLDAQRAKTDQARRVFRDNSADGGLRGGINPTVRRRMDAMVARLSELDALRRLIDQRGTSRDRVLEDYSALIDGIVDIFKAVTVANGEVARGFNTVLRISLIRELYTRQDALVTGVLSAGRWTSAEMDAFKRLNGAKELVISDTVGTLDPKDRSAYEAFLTSPDYARVERLEQQLLSADATERRLPIDQGTWRTASEAAITRLSELELRITDNTVDRSAGIALRIYGRLAAAGGLGLLAVVAATAVAWRVARRVIGESRRVSRSVTAFTDEYLPTLTGRIRRGEPIDPDVRLPRQDLQVTEIARINEAFVAAARAVVGAAARESRTRQAVNEVFVTLARRNQALVHRQLSLLDAMERRTEDPDELADLFRLDHLATRMRRHAEGLVILAGKTAGRTWRSPVPLVDVVRGAVAEVEDYTRVTVLSMPAAALAGNAVADTIHLLAELIENATLFSPPGSPVRITGQLVPNGFVVEIEDRGLGLKAETLEELNRRLAEPPEFDLSDLGRLGLFVVARLADRHDIKVSLRPSPYGGTTAIVLVPADLIVESPSGGLPPAELRAQLPGSRPTRASASAEAPSASTGPQRAVRTVTPVRIAEPEEEPARLREDDDPRPDVPAELPRRRSARRTAPERSEGAGAGSSGGAGGRPPAGGGVPERSEGAGARSAEGPGIRRLDGGEAPENGEGPAGRARLEESSAGGEASRQDGNAAASPEGADAADGAGGRERKARVGAHRAPVEMTPDGLPRRRRQKNLAPRLRDETGPQPAVSGGMRQAAELDEERLAAVRARMAAMQRGWQRGRAEAEEGQGTREDDQ
ncbi:nitrate- and nitrite sensing domain-containing protein [Thermomonospora catenispora]|uniref:sensor histidine kinase n=1 Tax=Thermomonospora catenispora TaxID=2493090 RepID=UPI001375FFAE|nr:nitrate- and nitrite sensing domain-containing protein [Thermomonospora catenispora]